MYKYVEIPKGKDELFNKFDELAIFNGEVCYALRCAYLHSGNYELKECGKGRIKISRFELCVSDNCQICKEYNKTCFPKVMILKKKQNIDYRSEI